MRCRGLSRSLRLCGGRRLYILVNNEWMRVQSRRGRGHCVSRQCILGTVTSQSALPRRAACGRGSQFPSLRRWFGIRRFGLRGILPRQSLLAGGKRGCRHLVRARSGLWSRWSRGRGSKILSTFLRVCGVQLGVTLVVRTMWDDWFGGGFG